VVDTVVVHNISLPPGNFSAKWVRALFQNRLLSADCIQIHPYFERLVGLRVSAHLYIQRNGRVVQCVPLHRRAWHAGTSQWAGKSNLNDYSVGIELAGDDDTPFTPAQYAALARSIRRISNLLPITTVVGHSDIAPDRKTDPGPHFDWPRLMRHLPKHLQSPHAT
jgi:N-acetyl-anhydromuramoyl-L-alanine amidase